MVSVWWPALVDTVTSVPRLVSTTCYSCTDRPSSTTVAERAPRGRVWPMSTSVLPPRQRHVPMVERRQAGNRLPVDGQLRLHGRLADPVLLEGLRVAGSG